MQENYNPVRSATELKTLSFSEATLDVVNEYEQRLNEVEADKKLEAYKKSGVPAKFFNTNFDNFVPANTDEQIIKTKILSFCKNTKNKILILCGENGNGKSLLGCGIIKQCGGLYIWSSDLCISFDAATSFHSQMTREELLKYYAHCSVLVIDECGKYTLNENLEKFLLGYIVMARYENNLPTVLITNSTKKDFVEFLGKAVFDRLTETCISFEFKSPSKRKSLREDNE